MHILITGSSGLIGSEAVTYYDQLGHTIIGVDNNMRREFFGLPGDTLWNRQRLQENTRHFLPLDIDIRDRTRIFINSVRVQRSCAFLVKLGDCHCPMQRLRV